VRRVLKIAFISFLVGSCSTNVKLKPISLYPLFNDSSSKVWLIDKVITNDRNFAPKENIDKDVVVFYQNGKCMYQPLKTLGNFIGKIGEYTIYSAEKNVTFYFPNERWDFIIEKLTEDTIILKPTKISDLKYQIVLIPFPEF
jgi:hypothetical protein